MAIQPVALDGVVPITFASAVESQSDEPNCGAAPPTAGIGRKTWFVLEAATECIVRGLPDAAGFTGMVCTATSTDWSSRRPDESTTPRTSSPSTPAFLVRHVVLQLGTKKWPSLGLNQTSSAPPRSLMTFATSKLWRWTMTRFRCPVPAVPAVPPSGDAALQPSRI